ncbi:uncharacterized protein [Procambarus clarkii]|uniref:uncharacterized protein n=1 Tax=Procambarus clarkii TaxID=6728 RepID=UPI003743900A
MARVNDDGESHYHNDNDSPTKHLAVHYLVEYFYKRNLSIYSGVDIPGVTAVRIRTLVIDMLRVNEVLNNQPIVNDVPINQPIVNDVPINQPIVNDVPINQTIVNDVPINQPIVNDVPINQPIVNDVPINQPIVNGVPINQPIVNGVPINQPIVNDVPINQPIVNDVPINQPIVNDVPINQPIVNDVPINQPIVNDVPINQPIVNDVPINQPIVNDVPINQPIVNDVPINQPIVNDVPINQPIVNDVPINQPIVNDVPINQPIVNDVPINQPIVNDVPINQPIVNDVPINQPIVNGVPINQPIVNGVPINQPIVNGVPINQPIVNGVPINQPIVNDVPINQPIVNDVPINQPIVNDVPINQPIVNGVPINQPIVNDVPINQPIVNGVPINQPIVNDVPINQPIVNGVPINQPIVNDVPINQPIVNGVPINQPIVNDVPINQPIVNGVPINQPIVNGVLFYYKFPLLCQDFRTACCWLHTSLPVDLRTSVMKEVASLQDLQDTERVLKLILFHLLADVAHICLVVRANTGRNMNLIHKYTEYLLQELESIPRLSLQSLHLDGVWMDRNIISQILRRSPNIRSIQVSGNLCRGVLNFLREEHCKLRSLHLISCTVNDEEVVSALVGTGTDFCTLGNIVCSGGDVTQTVSVALESLRHLTVQSPLVSVCGAMVLLHSLRELRFIQYRGWNSPVSDTLLLLQEVCPRFASFALSSIDLYRPSNKTVENLMVLCPKLQELMIEYTEPNLSSLDSLSGAQQLASLTLRIVSEELIVSAVKAVGKNLLKLKIEFENFTFHPISMETVSTIQEKCPRLQSLEMLHVNVRQNSNDLLPLSKKDLFPELETLILQSSLIQPALLERLIRGNKYLEHLVLDVNQDALTDQLLQRLLSDNDLHLLKIIFLGAGSLSSRSIASLVALPSLSKLSLVLKRFPFISMSTFSTLEANLVKENYHCVLENVYED